MIPVDGVDTEGPPAVGGAPTEVLGGAKVIESAGNGPGPLGGGPLKAPPRGGEGADPAGGRGPKDMLSGPGGGGPEGIMSAPGGGGPLGSSDSSGPEGPLDSESSGQSSSSFSSASWMMLI